MEVRVDTRSNLFYYSNVDMLIRTIFRGIKSHNSRTIKGENIYEKKKYTAGPLTTIPDHHFKFE